MSVNRQLAEIKQLLGEHTGLLKGIVERNKEMNESIRNLWKSQSAQDEKITELQTKASIIGASVGAAAGALVAGGFVLIRWLLAG